MSQRAASEIEIPDGVSEPNRPCSPPCWGEDANGLRLSEVTPIPPYSTAQFREDLKQVLLEFSSDLLKPGSGRMKFVCPVGIVQGALGADMSPVRQGLG